LEANLDQDAAEEQIILLQNRTNLSLPATIEIADFDQARKTYYLAWEGTILASASQPITLSLDDLIGDHQVEIILQGINEAGHPTLDVFRAVPSAGGLAFSYRTIFSKESKGSIQFEHPLRPESYTTGQNSDLSDPIVFDEPDPKSTDPQDILRTTYNWLFQKGEYVITGQERYKRGPTGDSALEKVLSGDNSGLEAFLQGPWAKATTESGQLLLLNFDPTGRTLTFATADTQESYRWDVSSRSSRGSLYIVGTNELINLIKLQMSVALTTSSTIDVNAPDDPNWSGKYQRLDSTAARALAKKSAQALSHEPPPVGVFKNDKGDEFDFQVPKIHFTLDGKTRNGAMGVFPLGNDTILQIEVPSKDNMRAWSRAYSLVTHKEANTSRVVRTLELQAGTLSSTGWVSDQSDPIRLEQVENAAP